MLRIRNIIFIVIIVILVGVVSYLVLIRKLQIPPLPESQQQTQLATLESIIENKLSKWIAMWKEIIPEFDISTFKKISEWSIPKEGQPIEKYIHDLTAKENKLREFLYVYSPDKTKFIDPYVYMHLYEEDRKIKASFDVDEMVALIDLENKKWKQILFCGPPCGFNDAIWIDDNTFVVVGYSEYYLESKSREERYINSTYMATLHIIDLLKNMGTSYYGPPADKDKIDTSYQPFQLHLQYLQDKFPNIEFLKEICEK